LDVCGAVDDFTAQPGSCLDLTTKYCLAYFEARAVPQQDAG
jgi:hypothetical protein